MAGRYPNFRKRPRWDATSAREWQNMANDLTMLMKIKGGPGIDVRVRPHAGVTISAQPKKKERREIMAAGVEAHQFRIIGVYADVLTCLPWEDGATTSEEVVWIAKLYSLRRSPRDPLMGGGPRRGIAYEYPASMILSSQRKATRLATGEQEDQVVVPAYDGTDLLHALPVTGKIDKVQLPDTAPSGTAVKWLELADTRAWARVRANASRV